MSENNHTLTDTVAYSQDQTGASNRRARRAAIRCFHDPQWCLDMFGIELYGQLHQDDTGEHATSSVLAERGY